MRIAAVAFSGVPRILFYPVLTIPHVQRLLLTCGTPWLLVLIQEVVETDLHGPKPY
jgi:hypothetical protein